MAIKTFVVNLSGGDAITLDNDLIFKIYGSADNFATPIKTTGSHTSDANVSITSGIVTIINVDVGAEKSFKLTAIDEALNESILSTALLFSDVFSGLVIDTNVRWSHIATGDSEIAQNGELLITMVNNFGFLTWLESKNIHSNTLKVLSFDIKSPDGQSNADEINYQVLLSNISLGVGTATQIIGILNGLTAGTIRGYVKIDNVANISADTAIDISTYKTFKCVLNGLNASVHYWNGSSWTQIHSGIFTTEFDSYISIRAKTIGALSKAGSIISIDNVNLATEDFSTQYP